MQKPPKFEVPTSKQIAKYHSQPKLRAFSDDEYIHWDKLRYKAAGLGFSAEALWNLIKLHRMSNGINTGLVDERGKPFYFVNTDKIQRLVHKIDKFSGGAIKAQSGLLTEKSKDEYLFKSLLEESISSSQLEGAVTTRKVAKDMILSERKPRDQGEKMIYNNYNAMSFLQGKIKDRLNEEFLFELHSIITIDTLESNHQIGGFRKESDNVCVVDKYGEIVHKPPKACLLGQRLNELYQFANSEELHSSFIHPVIKAIIIHFMLAYEHPFVDGNGRTARALYYWHVAKSGYWLMEFLPISRIIQHAPVQYGKAFLQTETDDNDLTYFIHYHLEVIDKALDDLFIYLKNQAAKLQNVDEFLKDSLLKKELNSRQISVLRHALENQYMVYSPSIHKNHHCISIETARKDFQKLVDLELFYRFKKSGAHLFVPRNNLHEFLIKM
ncbi:MULTISPECIES: Fic family protein [Cysteiniphilum]|uniref:Fic family protein n=1 Tax=Cysteiniphilum litorale TaxID=2056700 RepID=A0A8J2Z765_9GAMM|nr:MULTISPECIES: Fic family protein [Cysteiniphilum]GGG08994.1 Fic family protein [Cysteiniphilum litorale]